MQTKLFERVALSLNSDDLRLMQQACPLDKVIGSGWSSKTEPLGSVAFWAKYVGDCGRTRELVQRSKKIMVTQARRKFMGGSVDDLEFLGVTTVAYWLADRCKRCQGRGFIVEDGAQVDSGAVCKACDGSGVSAITLTPMDGCGLDYARAHKLAQGLIHKLDDAMCSYIAKTVASLRSF